MNSILQNFGRRSVLLGATGLLALMLSSCAKEKNITSVQATAAMAVIDASPDAPALDFYLGINRINASPMTLGGGINYFVTNAGTITASFYNDVTSTKLVSDVITLQANYQYSFFIANSIATPDFVLLKDSTGTIAAGLGGIRLVNLSPNAGAVDIGLKGKTAFATNISYKANSGFIPMALLSTDTLEVRATGTTTVLATLENTEIQNGIAYTVWLYGFANSTVSGEGLNAGIMANGALN